MPRSPALAGSRSQADPRVVGRWLRQELHGAEDTGYFGPRSAIWQLHQEAVLGVGLGRALLLQVAHPWVAQAVTDHSAFRVRPLDRLLATVTAAELLVFGSRRQAEATAARLCRVHAQIAGTLREDVGAWPAGTPYRADDPDALPIDMGSTYAVHAGYTTDLDGNAVPSGAAPDIGAYEYNASR